MFPRFHIFISTLLISCTISSQADEMTIKSFCSDNFKHVLIGFAQKTPNNPYIRQYELSGWLGLIQVNESENCTQSNKQQQFIKSDLQQWFNQYSNHPAVYFFPELFSEISQINKRLTSISVLLPFNKKYSPYSSSITNTIENLIKPYSIKVKRYDTTRSNPIELYRQAINTNSNCIVGPLRNEQINQLSQHTITTPVLALNPGNRELLTSSKFFKLAKTIDSEVSQLITIFNDNYYQKGILLYPKNNSRQRRFAKLISQQFINEYGQWLKIKAYNTNYSKLIQSILNTNQSIDRYNKLTQVIGQKPEFTARRRKDLDFIVLLGNAKQIQQIYPQIKYWFADDVPVYTSSTISPYINSLSKFDLSGIKFIPPFEEDKLYAMAKQAVDIIIQTNCFRLRDLLINDKQSLSWELEPEKGIFFYKSRSN
jgi:uncharacterized protein